MGQIVMIIEIKGSTPRKKKKKKKNILHRQWELILFFGALSLQGLNQLSQHTVQVARMAGSVNNQRL